MTDLASESHMLECEGWDAMYRVVGPYPGCQAPIDDTETMLEV